MRARVARRRRRFIETASAEQLTFNGTVDMGARRGSVGTLLLEAASLSVVQGCEFDCKYNSESGGGSTVTSTALERALASGNVTLETTGGNGKGEENRGGDISVDANVVWSSNNTLALSAHRNINIAAGVTIANRGSEESERIASGNLVLRADNTGTGQGAVNFLTGYGEDGWNRAGVIDFSQSLGTVSIYYDPTRCEECASKYDNPTNFGKSVRTNDGVSNQLTAYMLVNTAYDLAAIGTDNRTLTENYALGRNIDMSRVANFAPIGAFGGAFTGIFDGQGQTISNLTIAPTGEGINNIGLFAVIGVGGVVENLNLDNVRVTANPNIDLPGQFVGTLAGENAGTIRNVRASGQIDGLDLEGVIAGGLVGQNGIFGPEQGAGTISRSRAAVNVTLGSGCGSGDCDGALERGRRSRRQQPRQHLRLEGFREHRGGKQRIRGRSRRQQSELGFGQQPDQRGPDHRSAASGFGQQRGHECRAGRAGRQQCAAVQDHGLQSNRRRDLDADCAARLSHRRILPEWQHLGGWARRAKQWEHPLFERIGRGDGRLVRIGRRPGRQQPVLDAGRDDLCRIGQPLIRLRCRHCDRLGQQPRRPRRDQRTALRDHAIPCLRQRHRDGRGP